VASTETTPVIDMWAPIVPTRELMADFAGFPEPMLGYLRVFFKEQPTLDVVRELAERLVREDEEIFAELDRANIVRSLITGFDETSTAGGRFISNEAVVAIVERAPGRFLPFVGVDIMQERRALDQLEYWVGERGFVGLSLRPFMIDRPADDEHYYPFYAKCVELDIPVSIHASANWTTGRPSELGHPRHFDRVACDFPQLKLILSHAGYPWVLEACLLAWKHPNLYLELAAHRPKYFTAPGAGWEPLLRFGQSTIQDKVLYGTGAFLLGRRPADLLDELRSLPIRPEVLEKWLWRNAAALMKIDVSS